MPFDPRSLIDPVFFSRLESIELRARSIVEGSMHGLHRSPYLGMSVEFASHREYTPGDDLRHLNWKLYARHDRLYIKEYDADTNLNLYLLLGRQRLDELRQYRPEQAALRRVAGGRAGAPGAQAARRRGADRVLRLGDGPPGSSRQAEPAR